MRSIIIALLFFVSMGCVPARAQAGMLTPIDHGAMTAPNAGLTPMTTVTVECWFYFASSVPFGGSSPGLVTNDSQTSSLQLQLTGTIPLGSLRWIVWTTGGTDSTTAPTQLPANSWHHVAATYDGNYLRLYIDAVEVSSKLRQGSIVQPNPGSGFFKVGQGPQSDQTWQGSLDEMRVWDHVRTTAQMQTYLYDRLDGAPGLLACWHFDGGYQDYTGGHHGTPQGGMTIAPSTSPVFAQSLTAPAISPIGSPIVYTFASPEASVLYGFDVSVSGTSPGISFGPPTNKIFPLNPPLLGLTYGALLPDVFLNFVGTTQAGAASPVLVIPYEPALIGTTISAACATLASISPLVPKAISSPVTTVITALPPTLSGVAPPSGLASGGNTVTLSGSGFLPGAAVKFDGVAASSVVVAGSSTITCAAPAHAPGPVTVSVHNPDGNVATLPGAYTYVEVLGLSSVSPVVAQPGSPVTLAGAGFQPGLTVVVGGQAATPTSVSSGSLSYLQPAGVPCDSQIVVTNPDSQVASIGVNPSPNITNTLLATGPAAGGTQFFIVGTDFHPGTTVTVGGVPATVLPQSTTSSLLVVSPPGTPGPAAIVVSSLTGCTDSGFFFVYQ
jgi:Concanavalin A-like lectin/glucanases superfamily/IPT/TIG domain